MTNSVGIDFVTIKEGGYSNTAKLKSMSFDNPNDLILQGKIEHKQSNKQSGQSFRYGLKIEK